MVDTLDREIDAPAGQPNCPTPQYQNETTDVWERIKGKLGAAYALIKGGNGNTLNVNADGSLPTTVENIPHVEVDSLPALPAGDNNIGDVDIASALPAGTNNIGKIVLTDGTHNADINADGTLDVFVGNWPSTYAATQSGAWNIGTVTAVTGITNVVHVDDNNGSLTIDGSVSLAAALPAGNNNIGDVDVASMPVTHVIADSGTITSITNPVNVEEAHLHNSYDAGNTALKVNVVAGAVGADGKIVGDVSGNKAEVSAANELLTKVNAALPTGTNTIGSIQLIDGDGHVADITAAGKLVVEAAVTAGNSKIEGATSTNVAEVTAANELLVSVNTALPAGTANIGSVQLIDGDGHVADITAAGKLVVEAAVTAGNSKIEGSTSGNVAEVTAANEVKVLDSTLAGVYDVGNDSLKMLVVADLTKAQPQYCAISDTAGEPVTVTGHKLDVNASLATTDIIVGRVKITDGTDVALVDPNGYLETVVMGALPTGANTIGNIGTVTTLTGITNAVHVDDNNGSLTIDDGTGSITVDGSVSLAAALPTGNNNIGDVDVLSVIPGVGATNLGKAEDAVHASGDAGVMALAVRRDSPAAGSDADGDYSTLNVNSAGRLYTTAMLEPSSSQIGKIVLTDGSHDADINADGTLDVFVGNWPSTYAVTQSGAWNIGTVTAVTAITNALPAGTNNIGDVDVASVVPGTGATNLGKASGVTTYAGGDVGVPALALRSVTASAKANEGDYTVMQTDASGRLFCTAILEQSTGVDIGVVDIGAALPAGNNNIGNVDVASMPVTHVIADSGTITTITDVVHIDDNASTISIDDGNGAITVDGSVSLAAAIPAGTNLIGRVSASNETGTVYNGTTALTPKYAFANVAASQTDSAIVAAVADKKIRVLSLTMLTAATATNVTFNNKPAGAGTAISMLFANGANGGAVLPYNPIGWFETSVSNGLSVTTGAGSATGIQVTYVEI